MENPPRAGGGGGRSNASRNRKSKRQRAKKRDNSRRNAGGAGNKGNNNNKRNKGPPSPPQTKIVIRNIGDVNKHGSVKEVVELIRSMISGANQKLSATTSRIIQLDELSVECLIQEEEAILKAEAEESKKSETTAHEENVTGHDNYNEGEMEATTEETNEGKNGASHSKGYREKSDGSVQDSTTETSTTNLGARVVYIVPPKQTRRRGIKPGCAYLVISGPTIEAKDPVTQPLPSDPVPSDASKEEKKESVEEEESAIAESEVDNTKSNEETTAAPTQEQDGENHVVIVEPSTTAGGPAATAVPTVDYSREVAKDRFLLIQAIDVMEAHAKEDAKSDQKYAGSVVEVAMSGKTYKYQIHRRDRREGTLETTADYKSFVENAAKAKEELMARPKPAPGGGTTTIAAASTEAADSGQPIAALVEHIRSKRAEASKRKKAKKKAKEASNKEKGGGKSSRKKKGKEGTKEEGGKKGGRKKDGKKRKSGKKKNSKGAGANNASMLSTAPTAVLKPGAAAGLGAASAPPPMPPTPQQQAPSASLPGTNGMMGGFQGYG